MSQHQAGVIQFLLTVERIVYGTGVIDTLGSEMDRIGAQRVMLLTARSLEDGQLIRRIIRHLGVWHVGTLATEFEHVPFESIAAAVAAARRSNADTIVALGGGSVIDAAKAVRICIAAGLTSADDLGAFIDHPGPLINGLIPQLSIPTTLSGSEYTRSFSVTSYPGRKALLYEFCRRQPRDHVRPACHDGHTDAPMARVGRDGDRPRG